MRKNRSEEYKKRKRTPTYHTWNAMIQRCTNAKHPAYKNYGGRGVTVCKRWKGCFANFLEDMGERPEGLTLDRIDPEQGYSKENCMWASIHHQNSNQRRYKQRNEEADAIRQRFMDEHGINI